MLEAPKDGVQIRPAALDDAVDVHACVMNAYRHYQSRIGRPPGPMTQDYAQVIRDRAVFIALLEGEVAGVLVLAQTDEGFLLDNIAVDPRAQGRGVGRVLLELAEAQARSAGYGSIYLYTNVVMSESLELYGRIGYREYDRRIEEGYSRVYMRKPLP